MQRAAPASWAEKFPLSVCLQEKKRHRRAIAQSEAFWACSQSESGRRRPTSQAFGQQWMWLAESSTNWREWEGSRARKNIPSPYPANSHSYTHKDHGNRKWAQWEGLFSFFLPFTSSLSTNPEAVFLTNKGTGCKRERGGRGLTLQILYGLRSPPPTFMSL